MNQNNDPFRDPHDSDYREDTHDDLNAVHDSVGASPLSVAEAGSKPNRKGLFLILGVIVCLIAIFVIAERRGDKEEASEEADAAAVEGNLAVAEQLPADEVARATQIAIDSTGNEGMVPADEGLVPPASAYAPGDDLFGPPSPAAGGVTTSSAGDAGLIVPSESNPPSPAPGAVTAPAEGDLETVTYVASAEEAALEREMRAQALRQEREDRKAAERERLRAKGTLIATRSSEDSRSSNPLAQTLGTDGAGQLERALASLGDSDPASGRTNTRSDEIDITPGTRVQATTVTEFVAGQAGSGVIEARLSSPLRDRGRIILPAGTRAFGSATSSGWSPGRDARVSINFDRFVTPTGQVYRGEITAMAADPTSLAMSVKAKVDQNYMARIARGGTATAIDYLLTQDDARRSVFDAPSQRDMAVQDARERIGNVLNTSVGDESAGGAEIKLPAQTPILLVFGLRE